MSEVVYTFGSGTFEFDILKWYLKSSWNEAFDTRTHHYHFSPLWGDWEYGYFPISLLPYNGIDMSSILVADNGITANLSHLTPEDFALKFIWEILIEEVTT